MEFVVINHCFEYLLVVEQAQREEAAKKRALAEAIRAEQHHEELMGFQKAQGKHYFLLSSLRHYFIYFLQAKDMTMTMTWISNLRMMEIIQRPMQL